MRNFFNRKASDMPTDHDAPEAADSERLDHELGEPPANPGSDAANKLLRLQADFENYRRRNASSRQEGRDEARREMLLSLLPIYDNFLRALQHATDNQAPSNFIAGIEGIRMQFEELFRREGVEAIPSDTGSEFDPNLHEAMGTIPGANGEPNTIAQEITRGFIYKAQVLRPAQVLVYAEA